MARLIQTSAEAFDLLNQYQHIAMVGLSGNPFRPSHFAAVYMLAEGYDIIPINPREAEILGRKCYPSLGEAAKEHVIEIVDIFRNPKEVPPIVEEAIVVGAKVVWMQLGIVNEAAAQRALEAGLDVVMDRCVKLEHARFRGGQNLIGLNTGVISAKRLRRA
jgi:predicted CoA-binding protein